MPRAVFTLVSNPEYAVGSVCLAQSLALVHHTGQCPRLIVMCTDESSAAAVREVAAQEPTARLSIETVLVPPWPGPEKAWPPWHSTCFAKFRLFTAASTPLGMEGELSIGEQQLREESFQFPTSRP